MTDTVLKWLIEKMKFKCSENVMRIEVVYAEMTRRFWHRDQVRFEYKLRGNITLVVALAIRSTHMYQKSGIVLQKRTNIKR